MAPTSHAAMGPGWLPDIGDTFWGILIDLDLAKATTVAEVEYGMK
jgi:hypothetical protein